MSVRASRAYERSWADVLDDHAAKGSSTERLVAQLAASEAAALAFCRLLERWARGEPEPPTPGRRHAALCRAADRVETALSGLEGPLGRYLLELEPDRAEGRSWYGAPGAAELLEWAPILDRAGVHVSAIRVAPDRSSLWAGLFDLRENLLGRTLDDLRALAAA
jgi:hypothetical protein